MLLVKINNIIHMLHTCIMLSYSFMIYFSLFMPFGKFPQFTQHLKIYCWGFSLRVKSFLFCALEHDNGVSTERLKVSNYLLIILLYTCLCTNIYKMFSQHYVSHFRNPFCSPLFSLLKSKPIAHSMLCIGILCLIQVNLTARPHLKFTAWPQLADTTIPTTLYNLFL